MIHYIFLNKKEPPFRKTFFEEGIATKAALFTIL